MYYDNHVVKTPKDTKDHCFTAPLNADVLMRDGILRLEIVTEVDSFNERLLKSEPHRIFVNSSSWDHGFCGNNPFTEFSVPMEEPLPFYEPNIEVVAAIEVSKQQGLLLLDPSYREKFKIPNVVKLICEIFQNLNPYKT